VSSVKKVLVTGAKGFVGSNLVVALRRSGLEVAEIDVDSSAADLAAGISGAGVVYHLAGVNRPENEAEFTTGNVGSIEAVVAEAGRMVSAPTIVLSSSAQAELDNPYGRSKLAAERAVEKYAADGKRAAVIYRFPGIFGKWCRPNYNSVVATFCHNIARDLPVAVSDPGRVLELVYVDDVVGQLMTHIASRTPGLSRASVAPVFRMTVRDLERMIRAFRDMRASGEIADMSDPLTQRLLAAYTSYLPPVDLPYSLLQRTDARGTLAELARSPRFGQIFVSRTRPGMTRGNHYHDMKVEKFCVLDGDAVIRFRSVRGKEVTEHRVSGSEFKVVDIPPGMTHSIENVGNTEMIVLFWASEMFDDKRPDTYVEEVVRG